MSVAVVVSVSMQLVLAVRDSMMVVLTWNVRVRVVVVVARGVTLGTEEPVPGIAPAELWATTEDLEAV